MLVVICIEHTCVFPTGEACPSDDNQAVLSSEARTAMQIRRREAKWGFLALKEQSINFS